MAQPPCLSPEDRTAIVLDLLAGRITPANAARLAGVSTQTISTWRQQFVDAGRHGLSPLSQHAEDARRERELRREIARLKEALGEAHLTLRVRRNGSTQTHPRPRNGGLE